ncbi:MAG: Fe-S cluster assembly protein SufD [Caulobacteraceae bacterium]
MSLARAIETGDLAELPSRRDEDWRWTDMRGLIRVLPPRSPEASPPRNAGPFDGLAEREIAIVNGRGETSIRVPPGERRAIALRIIATPGAGSHAAQLEIDVGQGAGLTLLESYEGETAEYLSEIDIAIRLAADAAFSRIVLARDGAEAVSVSKADIASGPASRLTQIVVTSGARRQRLETRVVHPGAGAKVRLDGVYLLSGKRHADITTVVSHEGVDGTTDQLIKGVVRDQGRGVFQGRIVVRPGADKTDAKMGHHALVLSDRAEVDAKPELEIFADDVACAHGNTVGALDEDALFYARSRGIPEEEARSMLIEAFVGEVVDRIEHEGAREVVRALVAKELAGAP